MKFAWIFVCKGLAAAAVDITEREMKVLVFCCEKDVD